MASESAVQTIAFPSISTGAYGYPIEEAAKIAVLTVQETLARMNSGIKVTFCCFAQHDLSVYQALL